MRYEDAETLARQGCRVKRRSWNDESYAVWSWDDGRLAVFTGEKLDPSCWVSVLDETRDDWMAA